MNNWSVFLIAFLYFGLETFISYYKPISFVFSSAYLLVIAIIFSVWCQTRLVRLVIDNRAPVLFDNKDFKALSSIVAILFVALIVIFLFILVNGLLAYFFVPFAFFIERLSEGGDYTNFIGSFLAMAVFSQLYLWPISHYSDTPFSIKEALQRLKGYRLISLIVFTWVYVPYLLAMIIPINPALIYSCYAILKTLTFWSALYIYKACIKGE